MVFWSDMMNKMLHTQLLHGTYSQNGNLVQQVLCPGFMQISLHPVVISTWGLQDLMTFFVTFTFDFEEKLSIIVMLNMYIKLHTFSTHLVSVMEGVVISTGMVQVITRILISHVDESTNFQVRLSQNSQISFKKSELADVAYVTSFDLLRSPSWVARYLFLPGWWSQISITSHQNYFPALPTQVTLQGNCSASSYFLF